jgi:hypothetical protein
MLTALLFTGLNLFFYLFLMEWAGCLHKFVQMTAEREKLLLLLMHNVLL